MSASPPKETEVEQGDPSPDNSDHMDRGDPDAQARDLTFEFEVKEQDRWLPIANVARIMKTALPDNAKIAKEAKECMQECVSEFISFITSEGMHFPIFSALTRRSKLTRRPLYQASEKCQQEKRKTVNGEDILFAMTSLGFENYAEALKIYLAKYRETQSARGDNQNQGRPGSSYGSATAQSQGGPASMGAATSSLVGGGVAGGVPGVAPQSSGYPGQQESTTNNLLAAQLEHPDQDPNPYANVYPPGGGHNGTTDDPY
ncbi:hypothetical protein MMC15_006485 [Xylographa vitiligo]|nr:hypothetical protein [Xylographa vitiligo]